LASAKQKALEREELMRLFLQNRATKTLKENFKIDIKEEYPVSGACLQKNRLTDRFFIPEL
jgi:hypothetical protein